MMEDNLTVQSATVYSQTSTVLSQISFKQLNVTFLSSLLINHML